jgi:hypothetical protein
MENKCYQLSMMMITDVTTKIRNLKSAGRFNGAGCTIFCSTLCRLQIHFPKSCFFLKQEMIEKGKCFTRSHALGCQAPTLRVGANSDVTGSEEAVQ